MASVRSELQAQREPLASKNVVEKQTSGLHMHTHTCTRMPVHTCIYTHKQAHNMRKLDKPSDGCKQES